MRVAHKFSATLMVAFVVFASARGVVETERAASHYVESTHNAHRQMGVALSSAVEVIAEAQGWGAALRYLDVVEREQRDTQIRWVSLEPDAPPDQRPAADPALVRQHLAAGPPFTVDRAPPRGAILGYTPLVIAGRPTGALELALSTEGEEAFLREERLLQLTANVALVVLFLLLSSVLGRLWVGEPVAALVGHARRVARGDFGPSGAGVVQRDELGTLAREMDAMSRQLDAARQRAEVERAARLEVQAHLEHADRLASVGLLSATLLHEVGTPLNVITGRARQIADGELGGLEATAAAQRIHEQASRIASMMRGLLDHARRQDGPRTCTPLLELAQDVAALIGPLARRARVEVETGGEAVTLSVRRAQLRQVLVNLTTNAVQAMPDGGRVSVRVGRVERARPPDGEQRRWVTVAVSDRGVGIAAGELPHIFEAFHTTKPPGEGTGLGLHVTRAIVAEHGGWIDVESAVGAGSTFTVYLPDEEARS